MVEILHQDDAFLIVNKPAGMLSVPGNNPDDGLSLIEILKTDFPDARIVHRLDQATSGVMVVAVGLHALRHLSRQFEHRTVQKFYRAKVYGYVEEDNGIIDLPLICDFPNRPLQKVCYEHGKPSRTEWAVIDRGDKTTTLRLKPMTGRTHQLRVHCMRIGHPILGDRFYAHEEALQMSDRLELYACLLHISHPITNQKMIFDISASNEEIF